MHVGYTYRVFKNKYHSIVVADIYIYNDNNYVYMNLALCGNATVVHFVLDVAEVHY